MDDVFFLLAFALPFLLINFSEKVGLVFGSMALFYIILVEKLRAKQGELRFKFEKDTERLGDLFAGIIGFLVVIVGYTIIASLLKGVALFSPPATESVLGFLQSTTPVLKDSLFLSFLTFGVIVGVIETPYFFGGGYEAVLNVAGVEEAEITNPVVWAVWVFIAFVFTIFHITTRTIAIAPTGEPIFDNVALIGTFWFAIVSLAMVTITKELVSATETHIYNNSLGVLADFARRGVINLPFLT